MQSLEELIKKYKPYGMSDERIICQYFIENHLEDRGIELMFELTKNRTKFLNDKISWQKEYLMYNKSILWNPHIPEKDKLDLFNLVQTFLYYRDLNEDELAKCKDYFSKYKITACPVIFYNYLILNGMIDKNKDEIPEWEKEDLESFKKMRDN